MNYLNPPASDNITYKNNFLNRAIVEVRFPTLLEWEKKIPNQIITSLRKNFPIYEQRDNFNFGISNMHSEKNHCLISKNKFELVVFRASSYIFETRKYKNFEPFLNTLLDINKKVLPHLDTNFFTRVGLRYINAFPFKGDPSEILSPYLVNKDCFNILGNLSSFDQRIGGKLKENQNYTFLHGINNNDNSQYILDFDYFSENVDSDSLEDYLNFWHSNSFKFFNWAISDKLKELLNG